MTNGLTVPQQDALWDAITGPGTPTFTVQHERVCATVAELLQDRPYQTVKGRCPACGNSLLFLGDGGHITCSLDTCPNPSAADELLHGETPAATPRELELRQRRAWVVAGQCPMCGYDDTDGHLCDDCTATVRRLPTRDRRQWRRYEPVAAGTPIQGHGYTPAGLLGIDLDEPGPEDTDTTPAELEDTCRPVEIDGEVIRVRGAAEMSDESRAALAEVVSVAKRKYLAEHPPTEPVDPDRRERYAEALYATLKVTSTRHPWATLSPLRRAVWYARAGAAMAVADAELLRVADEHTCP